MQQLHASMNCLTTKGWFRTALQRLTQQRHQVICPRHISVFEFFDEPKQTSEREMTKNRVFVCRSDSHVSCMSASRNKCPEMVLWKAVIFASEKSICSKEINRKIKVWIFEVWFRIISSLFINSSKPWSYGMCSYCRDHKKQEWCKWLALCGWPFGGEDDHRDHFSIY
jgi:hypothetical protein